MTTLSPTEFFSRIWPAHLVRQEKLELRARDRKTGKIRREFFESPQDLLSGAEQYKDLDVYFGITTRFGHGGKKRDCYRINALWVDFDGYKLKDVRHISPRPNILVDSGGGVHAYWLLSSAIVVRDGERIKQIEAITRGLAEKFDGDTQAIDITRILRIPGYHNHKYTPPRPIKAHLLLSSPYSIDFFKRAGIYVERTDDPENHVGAGRVIRNLPAKVRMMLNKTGGIGYDGDTSRADSAVITAMLSAGLKSDDVFSTFMDSRRGRDAAERKAGHVEDYVQRTVRKAEAFIGKVAGNGHLKNGHTSMADVTDNVTVDFGKRIEVPDREGIVTQKASSVEVETPHWLWPLYIPLGKITLLAGDPGNGKSTMAIDLVARVSRGTFLPFGSREVKGNCLIASAEDAAADTIVPRLIVAQANLDKVEVMRQVVIDGELQYLSFPRDLNAMRELIIKRGARLVIIDPLSAFLSGEVDSYRDQDIRSVLAPVENIAEETGAAILIIAHLNKKEDTATPLYRIGGSIGLTGAARSVLGVQVIPGKTTRVLYSLKSNLGKKPSALEYDISQVRKTRSEEEWRGDEKVLSSRIHWISEVDFDPAEGVVDKDDAEDTVRAFLKQVVFDSEVSTDLIFKEARSAGISKSQVIRMSKIVGIKARRQKPEGKWYWSWPESQSS
jgi:archaellum biogenesis ATPase FlaH